VRENLRALRLPSKLAELRAAKPNQLMCLRHMTGRSLSDLYQIKNRP